MRIKKLELVGFKSFKDRTMIHFDAGITGIVGPNGCGKSNIVDALVWVMGEMSAKHLRGSSMEDVIFAGAEGYAPQGMAEVSLVLENEGGPFPAQYAKFSEIMVTRRLHRNGESEYLINKESARLKDVQEIFMDTGAGSKGFSIIEQGAIGKIITAKPEDRRTLIEEAAGITKFKARKRESQRKLVSTDENLVRLQDIVGELKRQLNSLERQAQKAERYREIKVQIEERDLWFSAKQFGDLKVQFDKASQELAELESSSAESQVASSQRQARLMEQKTALTEFESRLTHLQSDHFSKRSELQKKELTVRELQFEIEQARRSAEMTGSLVTQNQTRLEILQSERSKIADALGASDRQAHEAEKSFAQVDGQFREHQQKIHHCDEQLTQKRRELLTVSQGESHLDARIVSLRDQLSQMQDREAQAREVLFDLENKKQDFIQRRNQVFKQLEGERQMQLDIMRDVENFAENKKLLEAQALEKRSSAEEVKDKLNEVTSRLYGLENLHANFEGFEAGVKSIMLWQKQIVEKQTQLHADGSTSTVEVLRPVSEVIEVPSHLEVAMEAALGSRLQLLLSQDTDQVLGAVTHLKEQKAGRSSFLTDDRNTQRFTISLNTQQNGVLGVLVDEINVPERHRAAVEKLLGRVIVVDSIRTALSLRAQDSSCTYVTPEGDLLDTEGVLTGGSAEGADSGILKRRREIKDLSAAKEEWAGKLALHQEVLKKVEAQLQSVTRDLENAVKSSTEKEIRVAELKKDLERAENELKQVENAVVRQTQEVSQFTAQSQKFTEQVEELDGRIVELREKRLTLESEIDVLTKDLTASRDGVQNLQAQVIELKENSTRAREQALGLKRQLEMVDNSLGEVNSQLSKMNLETTKNTEVLTSSQHQLEHDKVALERLIHEVDVAESTLSQARNEFEVKLAEIRELESEASSYLSQVAQIQIRLSELKLKIDQAQMRMTYLCDHVREKYLQDLAARAEELAAREGDVAETEKQLQELREKLGRIGDVNLSAITEYDEIKTRYEFLTQQQNDLNEAKEQLRRVIERINRICSKRFKETFEAVNDRFTKVFPVLFGGGEARLILVEDVENGEMGIDIVAKPPGKKLQNVSLLSGGEKALTAVSLIFSIFLVKPSPYCLLDEVDAPLDDANVSRFNDLVKEMAKRSQIIVVTHNKYTMEVAERLYGVTMQEKGVSKMVSVSLADAQRAV